MKDSKITGLQLVDGFGVILALIGMTYLYPMLGMPDAFSSPATNNAIIGNDITFVIFLAMGLFFLWCLLQPDVDDTENLTYEMTDTATKINKFVDDSKTVVSQSSSPKPPYRKHRSNRQYYKRFNQFKNQF